MKVLAGLENAGTTARCKADAGHEHRLFCPQEGLALAGRTVFEECLDGSFDELRRGLGPRGRAAGRGNWQC